MDTSRSTPSDQITMDTYCNLAHERNALLAEQAAVLEQLDGEPRAIIEYCDKVHRQLVELEEEENARDEQANLQPPLHIMQRFNRYELHSSSQDYYSMDGISSAVPSLALAEEGPEETDCLSHYCGDDGLDADADFCNGNGSDGEDGNASNADNCWNCHLQERLCGRRYCDVFGCRIIEHQANPACFCDGDDH